jgi:mannose-6-phosphate isomerase-like protein (cupin superfamily)
MAEYITPPNHFGFKAKKVWGESIKGELLDCAIAHIEQHPDHSHLFIVTEGVATIYQDGQKITVKQEEAIYVDGSTLHSIWNEGDSRLTMLGITIGHQ